MSERLIELIGKYRRGRDAFDSLALAITQLYGGGHLLAAVDGEESTLQERVLALTPERVEQALAGKLPTVLVSREEYAELLTDITEFIKEWLGSEAE